MENAVYTERFYLSAGECDAQQEMSMPQLLQCLIDIATAHANKLGVGYARLLEDNNSWVLSRMSVEVKHMPAINEYYSLSTWVEDVNRHYSERIIEISDGDGTPIGEARLVWVAINIDTRRPADLTPLMPLIPPSERHCSISPIPRMRPLTEPAEVSTYRFQYSDIDFNRHVNSTRYAQLMLNCWSLPFYDANRIMRFDIAYMAEAHYGDEVEIRRVGDDEVTDLEIVLDGKPITRARVAFAPRRV